MAHGMSGIVGEGSGAGRMRAVGALALYKSGYHELRAYARAVRWRISHEVPDPLTPMGVYRLFYLDFLGVPEGQCEIVEVTERSLVTRCTNPCPILDLAGRLGRDTREVCRKVSERGCRFFLWGLGRGIRFERDYGTIRPHGPYCEERVTLPA
jgi:hypothetical protein